MSEANILVCPAQARMFASLSSLLRKPPCVTISFETLYGIKKRTNSHLAILPSCLQATSTFYKIMSTPHLD
ncbi:hypothetical protein FJZ31_43615 [Candidatus Poribacteria bacterium]|nr:hypothetical protein [Candidatus Poribacteria bacterium]